MKRHVALNNRVINSPIFGFLLLAYGLFCSVQVLAESTPPPQNVASINLCTDQLLLMLAKPEQVASISNLALEPNSSFMSDVAPDYPINHRRPEEIIALKPDVIVAGEYAPRGLLHLFEKLGFRVERFQLTSNIAQIRTNIRKMALLVGAPERGEQLIKRMDDRIAKVKSQRPKIAPKAAFYQPNGYTSGVDTLQHAALIAAGWRNLAGELGMKGYGDVALEQLLLLEPEQLFTSTYAPGTQSLAQRELAHPVLQRITQGRPIINIGYKYWICGGPMIAGAIELLHQRLPK